MTDMIITGHQRNSRDKRRVPRALSLGAAAAAAVALAAGGVLTVAPAGAVETARGSSAQPDSDRFAAPPVDWGPCDPNDFETIDETGQSRVPSTYQCADYEVPLDYDEPDGETITLALVKRPADNPAARQGTMFWNSGGPGGDAVETTAYFGDFLFTPGVRANYDIVGMDPRGIARSTPLQCYESNEDFVADAATDAFQGVWPDERREWFDQARDAFDLAWDCRRNAGPIIDHMSTANVARDLDVLRRAVADDDFRFVGYSYGTFVCAAYANLFPERVGAMVCDANIDPVEWTTGEDSGERRQPPVSARTGAGASSEETLSEFFRLCEEAGPEQCALAPDAAGRFDRLYDTLAAQPLVIGDGVAIDEQDIANFTLGELYDSRGWRVLAATLADGEAAVGGVPAAAAPAASVERSFAPPVNEQYANAEGSAGVSCTDGRQPRGMGAWWRAVERAPEYLSPIWANLDNDCAYWPGRDRDRYLGPFTAETAAPVLIVNPRFDPATGYDDALAHRDLLPNSALLTVEGWGHTTVGMSACANAVIDEYLLTGQVPATEITCTQEVGPFDVPAVAAAASGEEGAGEGAEGATEGAAEDAAEAEVEETAEVVTEALSDEVVEEAAGAALTTLAETGDVVEAGGAAEEVVVGAVEEVAGDELAERLRAQDAILDGIREATFR